MKKKMRTWVLILGMATPTLFAGCLSTLGRDVRDAAVQGTADAVHDTVLAQLLAALAQVEG